MPLIWKSTTLRYLNDWRGWIEHWNVRTLSLLRANFNAARTLSKTIAKIGEINQMQIVYLAAIVGIALVGTYLVKLALDWHVARLNVRARLREIRDWQYDWRIYENSWNKEI
jgi:hypothetical protein